MGEGGQGVAVTHVLSPSNDQGRCEMVWTRGGVQGAAVTQVLTLSDQAGMWGVHCEWARGRARREGWLTQCSGQLTHPGRIGNAEARGEGGGTRCEGNRQDAEVAVQVATVHCYSAKAVDLHGGQHPMPTPPSHATITTPHVVIHTSLAHTFPIHTSHFAFQNCPCPT